MMLIETGESSVSTANEKVSIWNRYVNQPTLELKNELVLEYIYLVKCIVRRLMPTYEGYANYDDLLSSGVLGLIDAIDKYDASKEVKFEYYASMRIKGEIIDHIRKQDWAPSSLRRKIQAIGNAYVELENAFMREPTDEEVAQSLGMNQKQMQGILNKSHMFNVLHFEEQISEGQPIGNLVKDDKLTPEEQFEKKELKRILAELVDTLPEREKLVIALYYYEELTLKEIAGVLGVSESRVSQIHSKVILKLKTKMQRIT